MAPSTVSYLAHLKKSALELHVCYEGTLECVGREELVWGGGGLCS